MPRGDTNGKPSEGGAEVGRWREVERERRGDGAACDASRKGDHKAPTVEAASAVERQEVDAGLNLSARGRSNPRGGGKSGGQFEIPKAGASYRKETPREAIERRLARERAEAEAAAKASEQ